MPSGTGVFFVVFLTGEHHFNKNNDHQIDMFLCKS